MINKTMINNAKNTIKNIIKKYGYTMIDKSFFMDDETSCIFNMYDKNGTCHQMFVYFLINSATIQSLSTITIHKPYDVSYWFDDVSWDF